MNIGLGGLNYMQSLMARILCNRKRWIIFNNLNTCRFENWRHCGWEGTRNILKRQNRPRTHNHTVADALAMPKSKTIPEAIEIPSVPIEIPKTISKTGGITREASMTVPGEEKPTNVAMIELETAGRTCKAKTIFDGAEERATGLYFCLTWIVGLLPWRGMRIPGKALTTIGKASLRLISAPRLRKNNALSLLTGVPTLW